MLLFPFRLSTTSLNDIATSLLLSGITSTFSFTSLFILTSLGALAMVIQSTYPGLLLITSVSTFVTFIMYFTTLNNEVISKLEKEKK